MCRQEALALEQGAPFALGMGIRTRSACGDFRLLASSGGPLTCAVRSAWPAALPLGRGGAASGLRVSGAEVCAALDTHALLPRSRRPGADIALMLGTRISSAPV